MVCIQENSPNRGHGPFGLMTPLSRAGALIGQSLFRRAQPPRAEDDLQRLAETSPHLLEDIGCAPRATPENPYRPLWARGI